MVQIHYIKKCLNTWSRCSLFIFRFLNSISKVPLLAFYIKFILLLITIINSESTYLMKHIFLNNFSGSNKLLGTQYIFCTYLKKTEELFCIICNNNNKFNK